MTEKRPAWWPEWEPNEYKPFAFHSQVFDAGLASGVAAVLAQLQSGKTLKDLERELAIESSL